MLQAIYPSGSRRFAQGDAVPTQYLQCCLLAIKDVVPVARLAIYHNPHISYHGQPTWLLGCLEFIEDAKVLRVLLDEVAKMAKAAGIAYLLGPMNGSTWEPYRFALAAVEDPFFTEPAQPGYYAQLLQQQGFAPCEHYYTDASLIAGHPPADPQLLASIQENGLRIRPISVARFEDDLRKLYGLCTIAFAQNVFYSPIAGDDFVAKYRALLPVINPDFLLLAEDAQGSLMAFVLALPDVYHPQAGTLIVKTIARHPDCKAKGLVTLLIQQVLANAATQGYAQVLHTFYHESNKSAAISRYFTGAHFREYALFVKQPGV